MGHRPSPRSMVRKKAVGNPLKRRLIQLSEALTVLERWTSNSRPVNEIISEGLAVNFHSDSAKEMWEALHEFGTD